MTHEPKTIPPIGPAQLDAVLRFLPLFEQPGYVFGVWHLPKGQFPFYAPNDEVMAFMLALESQRITFPFDWPGWQAEAQRYVDDSRALDTADLGICRRLLTTHVRLDRFAEGHLARMLETGHIAAILRRMQQIHNT